MQHLLPLISALLITLLSALVLEPVAHRIGLVDKPGGRKHHEGHTPLIGGIAMFIGICSTLLLQAQWLSDFLPLLTGALILLVVGVWDDLRPMPVRYRFAAQILSGIIMVTWGDNAVTSLGPLLSETPIELGIWSIPFTILGVVGVINAVNMVDGIDALAGNLSMVTLVMALGFLVSSSSHIDIVLAFTLIGSLIAFLFFNGHTPKRKKARIFMGDSGSMLLGYCIAWLLISMSQQPNQSFEPVMALWLFALPLFDTVAIMLRRLVMGRSPFAADREHLHHIFMVAGYSVTQTYLIMTILAIALAFTAIVAHRIQVPGHLLFYTFMGLFALYFFAIKRAWRLMKLLPKHSRGKPAMGHKP